MDKQNISQEQDKSIKNANGQYNLRKWSPLQELLDKKSSESSILECLLNNDPEGVLEMIEIYLEALKRAKAAKEKSIPNKLKNENITIKELAKLVHDLAA